jgi:hypothetical protein
MADTDEFGLLSPSVLTMCLQRASRSFLDQQAQGTAITALQWNQPTLYDDQPVYDAFMDVFLQEAAGGDTCASIDPSDVFPDLHIADDRAAYIDQLNYARNRYLGLLLYAPRHLSASEVRAATSILEEVARAAQTYHAAFATPATLSVNTAPSTEGINNVFSDLALSPQTDHTTAPDTDTLGPSGRTGYQGSPAEAANSEATLPSIYEGTDELALFDLGPDIGSANVDGSLNFMQSY